MTERSLGPTYRLQLRPGFGFEEAAGLAGYLADLGVELAYLSPVAEAVAGSRHGYDGIDPDTVREELGGRAGFDRLVAELAERGLGVLLDIVPNHLATWPRGLWWGDVLRLGRESAFAAVFDIDWEAGGGKVTLPVLGAPLEEVLGREELSVAGGWLRYGDLELPLAPGTGEEEGDGGAAAADVARVLEAQHYRLAFWRDPHARNYRRFFDVDGLAGVRVEDPAVFERTHRLVAQLTGSGAVQALRVDHVDGLTDPARYLARLAELTGVPIVVEKILTGPERLPDWPVAGTTGYESIDDISGALADTGGIARLTRRARRDGDRRPEDVVPECKRLVATTVFPTEIERTAELLEVQPVELAEAAAALPVYRTYLGEDGVRAEDRALIAASAPPEVATALLDLPGHLEGCRRYQQVTGPVMAKGVEDTAWYRLVGPLPFLEVGGDPASDRWRVDGARRLHERAGSRADRGECGLVPGTTHDTKRSADVRARLIALAEVTHELEAGLVRLAELAPSRPVASGPPVPSALDRRLVAATLLAIAPLSDEGWEDLAERIGTVLTKSAREAKLRSSWMDPDREYEGALADFARSLLAEHGALLHAAFGALVDEVAVLGATISLGQVVLRSCLPGVPDCYQGDECWNFSLVDPDNRRSVDFGPLARLLAEVDQVAVAPEDVGALAARWRDGRIKLLVTRAALAARRSRVSVARRGAGAAAAAAFAPGAAYEPLAAHGAHAVSALAFARVARKGVDRASAAAAAIAVVTRFPRRLASAPDEMPVSRRAWGDTWIELPGELAARTYVDTVSGLRHRPVVGAEGEAGRLELGTVLSQVPVALLVAEG